MCDCTPDGRVRTTDFGSACAPRSEDSGMAGPERPCRAATARGGGAHAAQRRCQYEGTEVRHLIDCLMVKTERLRQADGRKGDPFCSRRVQLGHTNTHRVNVQLVSSLFVVLETQQGQQHDFNAW